ncbi:MULTISPECIES: TraR/DksA family transcriptional regulator [Nonomuraea]|uniref:TraR/DksA family transcriptional regulator n=1 Tax=Nonomuraea mangrovi TaxID=2316207 RepID=A0ABW4T8C8_9ACTN
MTQYDDVRLSDVQVQAIHEDLQGQLMWRASRLDELRALAESVENGDGSLQGVLADLAATERSITEIHLCLERLSDRSYGRCAGCGEAIPFERLKIRPLTRHCMPCRRLHEAR